MNSWGFHIKLLICQRGPGTPRIFFWSSCMFFPNYIFMIIMRRTCVVQQKPLVCLRSLIAEEIFSYLRFGDSVSVFAVKCVWRYKLISWRIKSLGSKPSSRYASDASSSEEWFLSASWALCGLGFFVVWGFVLLHVSTHNQSILKIFYSQHCNLYSQTQQAEVGARVPASHLLFYSTQFNKYLQQPTGQQQNRVFPIFLNVVTFPRQFMLFWGASE